MNKKTQKAIMEFRRLLNGYQATRVILTANNLGVFDRLVKGKGAAELAAEMKTDLRATEILLNALAALGLLEKSRDIYRNSEFASRILTKDSPLYQGDMVRHVDTLWKNWSALDEVMVTGMPAGKARNHESFIRAMHNNAVLRAKDVIDGIDLKGVKNALDLGGGPGTYSIELARRGISVTLFDLPDTVALAREFVSRAGARDVTFLEGDFLSAPIGAGYDLVFISQVLHSFSEETNIRLLSKVREALNPRGRIAIQEFYLEKSRTAPLPGALFSVNMLVNTEGGRSYSEQEIKGWLKDTGYVSMRSKRLNEAVLIIARKK